MIYTAALRATQPRCQPEQGSGVGTRASIEHSAREKIKNIAEKKTTTEHAPMLHK